MLTLNCSATSICFFPCFDGCYHPCLEFVCYGFPVISTSSVFYFFFNNVYKTFIRLIRKGRMEIWWCYHTVYKTLVDVFNWFSSFFNFRMLWCLMWTDSPCRSKNFCSQCGHFRFLGWSGISLGILVSVDAPLYTTALLNPNALRVNCFLVFLYYTKKKRNINRAVIMLQ